MRKSILAGAAAGAFLVGAAGAALALPQAAEAADPTTTPAATTTPTATTTPAATTPGTAPAPTAPTTNPPTSCGTVPPGPGGHGPGGLDADDLTAAAKALGMTEAELTTALQSGKTPAQVAADESVDVQKVIDAIVAADKAEIEAAVTEGTMTQAQADARLANLAQHVTDEVNGLAGGPGGGHGPGGFDGGGQQPAASPTTGTGTGSTTGTASA